MPIFKLQKRNNNIENGLLIPAQKTSIELEKHLESWLENSPWAIAQEPLLIIGRQASAPQEESGTIFPDLLGLDKDGNLVIIELKKGKTPRDVVAQLLEYAAWANDLSEENIRDIASNYFAKIGIKEDIETQFLETFEVDEFPPLNRMLRLFIAAEEIAPSVAKVCRFLRQVHGVDISLYKYGDRVLYPFSCKKPAQPLTSSSFLSRKTKNKGESDGIKRKDKERNRFYTCRIFARA